MKSNEFDQDDRREESLSSTFETIDPESSGSEIIDVRDSFLDPILDLERISRSR